MKTIYLSNETLTNMIQESVRRVLRESCWYGDTKPFEQILTAANQIMDDFHYVTADDYEPWDDCDGPDMAPQIYEWAKNVARDAEYYLHDNSSYAPINGGEDW